MASENKRTTTTLVWILVFTFLCLCVSSFFLYQQTEEVRALNSQKSVLVRQLADEVLAKQRIKKQMDSLIDANESLRTTVEDSSITMKANGDMQFVEAEL